MGVGGVLHGPKIGPTFLPSDIWFQDLATFCSQNNRMLCVFYFLDKRGADGIIGGCDVYK